MSRRTKILAAAAVLAVVALVLSRGSTPSEQLQALKADPLASYAPPGGTLVDTDAQNEGTALGKPVSARYSRMFKIAAGTEARALERARVAAAAAGWELQPPSKAFPDVFVADKRMPSGRVELGVTVFRDARVLPEGVTPPALLVSLRHLGR